ncbi:hypothetical protein DL93DRAFT_2079528 [Clavulina sp. PMI_390]|nr:hypothetical protein DL93DRAFT_2079528 [Clavulina sp. PMI_390]
MSRRAATFIAQFNANMEALLDSPSSDPTDLNQEDHKADVNAVKLAQAHLKTFHQELKELKPPKAGKSASKTGSTRTGANNFTYNVALFSLGNNPLEASDIIEQQRNVACMTGQMAHAPVRRSALEATVRGVADIKVEDWDSADRWGERMTESEFDKLDEMLTKENVAATELETVFEDVAQLAPQACASTGQALAMSALHKATWAALSVKWATVGRGKAPSTKQRGRILKAMNYLFLEFEQWGPAVFLLPMWHLSTLESDHYARPAADGSLKLYTGLRATTDDFDARWRRRRRHCRRSLLTLVEAFMGESALQLMCDALNLVDLAVKQRLPAPDTADLE